MTWYVLRFYSIQEGENLTPKYAVYTFDTRVAAEKQYYKLLAADIDDMSKVTVLDLIMDAFGNVVEKKMFDHRAEVIEGV